MSTEPAAGQYQDRFEIAGTQGVVRINLVTHRVHIAETPPQSGTLGQWREVAVPRDYDAATVAGHLAEVVLGQAKPLATVEDAWSNLAVALAFYDAARSGRAVSVKELPGR